VGLDRLLFPYSLAEWIAENVQKSILTLEILRARRQAISPLLMPRRVK
jgi:hypothetical protein